MKLMNLRLQKLENDLSLIIEMVKPGLSSALDPRLRARLMREAPDFYKTLNQQNNQFTLENINAIFSAKFSKSGLPSQENLLLETIDLRLPLASKIIMQELLQALTQFIASQGFKVCLDGTPLHFYSDTTAAGIRWEYQSSDSNAVLKSLAAVILPPTSAISQNGHSLVATQPSRAPSSLNTTSSCRP